MPTILAPEISRNYEIPLPPKKNRGRPKNNSKRHKKLQKYHQLSDNERKLLKLDVESGMTFDALGKKYGVSSITERRKSSKTKRRTSICETY